MVDVCRLTYLNLVGPKDTYHLPNIDRLIDGASGYRTLSLIDAYSGYNQFGMEFLVAFMTNTYNYHYKVMSFELKNTGATYQ